MAQLNDRQSALDSGFVRHQAARQRRAQSEVSTDSSVPDSDKENANSRFARSSLGKRKTLSHNMSTPEPVNAAAKRRRLDERAQGPASQAARAKELGEKTDTQFYDPDQDERTKRETTKRLRELNANLSESRAEYIQRGSRGIQNTINEADELYKEVKQTSIAALDSRLLVNVGDLAYKKINTMTLGDSSTGIDVDDFLTKCINYMKTSPDTGSTQISATQRRRQQRRAADDGSENEEADEDLVELDWAYMGRTLCFPANNRPCLSSFLLGPLSTKKRVRQQTQRKATQRTQNPTGEATRPIELDQEALERQESASLTQICSEIATLLTRAQAKGEQRVSKEVDELNKDPSEEELKAIMRKHTIADNGGVPLFNFCVNPRSFGQTVENFFYVSFLIKEGKVGLDFDSDGLPTLGMCEVKNMEKRQESIRNQAVFTLDFDMWEELVESFGIERCVIPHRKKEEWEEDDGVLRPGTLPAERERGDAVPGSSDETARGGRGGVMLEDEELYA